MIPKLIITGHARHGKDTVCEYIRDRYQLSFISSSYILLEEVIYPALKEKYNYSTKEECYEDRVNHRSEWFNLLVAYNTPDLSALGRVIFNKADIYCGLRNINEFESLKNDFQVLTIWVDSSKRLPPEDNSSMTILSEDCDYVLDNNGVLADLYINIDNLLSTILDFYKVK